MELLIKRGGDFNYVEMKWVGSGSAWGTFRKSSMFYTFSSEWKKWMQNYNVFVITAVLHSVGMKHRSLASASENACA
jgi:hypothetical protein